MLKIAIAAFSATNLMTTFSYLMAGHYNTLFLEPVALNNILRKLKLCIPGKYEKFSGWAAHYLIGLAIVAIYEFIWCFTIIKFGWISGLLLGFATGLLAILAWQQIFKLPSREKHVATTEYYIQLVLAHLIFALAVVAAFKLYEYDPLDKIF